MLSLLIRSWKFTLVVPIACSTVMAAFLLAQTEAAPQLRSAQAAVLHSFEDSPDGADAFQSPVFRDSAGNLYGTTIHGGTQSNGTIFKVSREGQETVLYRFAANPDGSTPDPESGVIGVAGNLYGTEALGGTSERGTVFQLDSTGKFTILHVFSGGVDGSGPAAGLVNDAQGNIYGVTTAGGNLNACTYGCGTVFKLDGSGTFSVLYAFKGGTDGAIPAGTLILDSAGNLYGTTEGGGVNGTGTLFTVSSTGQERVLYSFSSTGQFDGMEPQAGLARDSAGNLYGTTYYGGGGSCFDGINPGCGTVFELSSAGGLTVLHSFSGKFDGGWPAGAVVLSGGNLYGTASGGGALGAGTVFQISHAGAFTLVHAFTGGDDGSRPMATLSVDNTGALYGTTAGGGASGFGEVFKLVP